MLSKEIEEGKIFAFLATFLTIIGFIIVLLAKKDNKYAVYYAKQGLVLFILSIIIFIAAPFIAILLLPIGWIIPPLLYIFWGILWVISWIYALSGKMKPVPLIGRLAEKFNF